MHGWLRMVVIDIVVPDFDIFASSTGEFNIITLERVLTQISRAGDLKRPLPNCQAGPTASSTPHLLDAQMPWGGHPLCGRPAGYLPQGTVGQWPLAALQWRTVRKGGDPITDQEGTTRTPGWHPEENATQLPEEVVPNQRGLQQRIAKGRGPKTLERAVKLSEGIVACRVCKSSSYFLWCDFSFTCDPVSLATAARIPLPLPISRLHHAQYDAAIMQRQVPALRMGCKLR